MSIWFLALAICYTGAVVGSFWTAEYYNKNACISTKYCNVGVLQKSIIINKRYEWSDDDQEEDNLADDDPALPHLQCFLEVIPVFPSEESPSEPCSLLIHPPAEFKINNTLEVLYLKNNQGCTTNLKAFQDNAARSDLFLLLFTALVLTPYITCLCVLYKEHKEREKLENIQYEIIRSM